MIEEYGVEEYLLDIQDAVQIGANTFQLFIRNPRGARAKELKPGEIETFLDILQKHGWS